MAMAPGTRRVLVTGAASGIGRAVVERFRATGDHVFGVDLDWNHYDGAPEDVGATCDVTDEASVSATLTAAIETLSRLDVLVNCAGAVSHATVPDQSLADFNHLLAVNVLGPFLTAKHAIPTMASGGGGAIINVASQLGLVAAPASAAYCASKGALIQLTRAMALDHAHQGLTVNAVCPGPTETPLLHRDLDNSPHPQALRAGVTATIPVGRFAQPSEIAAAVSYFADPDSRATTGTCLVVDGGITAQ